jgi:hypothetical protein
MVPHLPEVVAAAEPDAPVLDAPVLDAAAELEELDEPDEQAARPSPAKRARAATPPVCTALIYVSFDAVAG